jgi:hypothetical protein
MTVRKIAFTGLLATVSVPFAFWFWMYVVDIFSIPFQMRYWHVEYVSEISDRRQNVPVGLELVSGLTYTDLVQCRMTAIETGDLRQSLTGIVFDFYVPAGVPEFIIQRIQRGCIQFTRLQIQRLAAELQKE